MDQCSMHCFFPHLHNCPRRYYGSQGQATSLLHLTVPRHSHQENKEPEIEANPTPIGKPTVAEGVYAKCMTSHIHNGSWT